MISDRDDSSSFWDVCLRRPFFAVALQGDETAEVRRKRAMLEAEGVPFEGGKASVCACGSTWANQHVLSLCCGLLTSLFI